MPKYESGLAAATFTRTAPYSIPRELPRVVPREQSRWEVERARADLRALEALEANWDGYGAEPLSRKVRLNAWHAFDQAVKCGVVADPAPRANGTVSLEWEVGRVNAHLQIGDSTYSMYIRTPQGSQYFSGLVSDGMMAGILALRASIDDHERASGVEHRNK